MHEGLKVKQLRVKRAVN